MTENNDNDEKFIRWQDITIAQLSYAINLILAFSVAAIGFGVSLLLNNDFEPESWQSCFFSMSLLLLLASGAFGIWCTINRLRDFRATAKTTNLKRKEGNETELANLRSLTKRLGEKTWGIFWWQIGTFSAGILLLVLSVTFTVSNKLL